jgi:hypothetical protein
VSVLNVIPDMADQIKEWVDRAVTATQASEVFDAD